MRHPIVPAASCATCLWWTSDRVTWLRQCRVGPPLLEQTAPAGFGHPTGEPYPASYQPIWPVTAGTDWCGAWENRAAARDSR